MAVYHYHIPRTGGTSINLAFFPGPDRHEFYRRLNRDLVVEHEGKRYVRDVHAVINSGEYEYGFSHVACHKLRVPEHVTTFTIIRNPVDRLLSRYRALWMRRHLGNPCPDMDYLLRKSVLEFVAGLPDRYKYGTLYSFSPNMDVAEARSALKARNVLKRKVDVVIYHDHYSHGIADLEKKVGRKLVRLKENGTQEFAMKQNVKPTMDLLEMLAKMILPEVRLWVSLKEKRLVSEKEALACFLQRMDVREAKSRRMEDKLKYSRA